MVLLAFLRISTHPSIFPNPLPRVTASNHVDAWLAAPGSVIVEPADRHTRLMRQLLHSVGTAGNLVNDAHLAALAASNDAEVVSSDKDFERFNGVRRFEPPTA